MASWCKYEKKCGAKYKLKFCSGWMNIRQNKHGAMIISLKNNLLNKILILVANLDYSKIFNPT